MKSLIVPNPLKHASLMEFITEFRQANYALNFSLREIARKLKLSPGYLSGVFSGEIKLSPKKAARLATFGNLSPVEKIYLVWIAMDVEDKEIEEWLREQIKNQSN